jgi:hypothetical protein
MSGARPRSPHTEKSHSAFRRPRACVLRRFSACRTRCAGRSSPRDARVAAAFFAHRSQQRVAIRRAAQPGSHPSACSRVAVFAVGSAPTLRVTHARSRRPPRSANVEADLSSCGVVRRANGRKVDLRCLMLRDASVWVPTPSLSPTHPRHLRRRDACVIRIRARIGALERTTRCLSLIPRRALPDAARRRVGAHRDVVVASIVQRSKTE